MTESDKHIKNLIEANDKFRETFSGYWLGKINGEIEWLRSYVKNQEDREANSRQMLINF